MRAYCFNCFYNKLLQSFSTFSPKWHSFCGYDQIEFKVTLSTEVVDLCNCFLFAKKDIGMKEVRVLKICLTVLAFDSSLVFAEEKIEFDLTADFKETEK